MQTLVYFNPCKLIDVVHIFYYVDWDTFAYFLRHTCYFLFQGAPGSMAHGNGVRFLQVQIRHATNRCGILGDFTQKKRRTCYFVIIDILKLTNLFRVNNNKLVFIWHVADLQFLVILHPSGRFDVLQIQCVFLDNDKGYPPRHLSCFRDVVRTLAEVYFLVMKL